MASSSAAPSTAGNPLSGESLAGLMAASLPRDASPPLKNAYDVLALAVHAGMIAVGFRLIGLGEDHRIDADADAQHPKPLPSEWNASSSHAFRYAHSQSSMEFLVKVNSLGPKALVFALAVGHDKTAQFEVTVDQYISKSTLSSASITASSSLDEVRTALQSIFISPGRLTDFAQLLKVSIIQKLAPGITKQGYEEEVPREIDDPNANTNTPNQPRPPRPHDPGLPDPAHPHPFNDPLAEPPRRGQRPLPEPIPGFEDEYEINRPPRGAGAPRGPFPYGDQDLYPPGLGPHDPLRPHLGPGGMRPPGGGMHPTFDDPLFGGGGEVGGYDPMAPPGARFDPVGPGGAPRDGRMGPRFPGGRGGGFGGGGPPNPFGGFGQGDFI